MKKTWFKIEAKANGTAEIAIYDEIGMFGISAKQFNEQLKALGDVQKINLRINSPGGDVFDGVAIFNMLKRHKATVHVTVDGLAASIASVIAMAGDHIVMPDNAMMMIHNPWGGAIGEADDMRDMAEALDKIKVSILSAYRRTGKTDDEISAMMDGETWLTAAEAVASGFADEVIETVQIAALFDLSRFQNAPAALAKPQPAPRQAPPPSAPDPEPNPQERSATLAEAAGIVEACAAAGHQELAAGFLARAASLDEVKSELAQRTNAETAARVDDVKKIYALCQKAGVVDLADVFIGEARTAAWVEDRLKDAARIRARCAAAELSHRADGYIRAGLTLDEVAGNLLEIKFAVQSPEIDNHIEPERERRTQQPGGTKLDYAAIYSRYRNGETAGEIYARRNSRNGSAGELGAKLARVIAEHMGR